MGHIPRFIFKCKSNLKLTELHHDASFYIERLYVELYIYIHTHTYPCIIYFVVYFIVIYILYTGIYRI